MRGLVRKNSAFSSLRCSRVHSTAAAADRVEPVQVRLQVGYGEVVVARDRRHPELAHDVAALVRVRPVADHVAKAVDGL